MVTEDGTCTKCPEHQIPSENGRECAVTVCNNPRARVLTNGACHECEPYKIPSEDKKECVDAPKCAPKFYMAMNGQCKEKCDDNEFTDRGRMQCNEDKYKVIQMLSEEPKLGFKAGPSKWNLNNSNPLKYWRERENGGGPLTGTILHPTTKKEITTPLLEMIEEAESFKYCEFESEHPGYGRRYRLNQFLMTTENYEWVDGVDRVKRFTCKGGYANEDEAYGIGRIIHFNE